MATSELGRKLLKEAAILRESGKTLESLQGDQAARIQFLTDGDLLGAAESLAADSLAYRHLWQSSENANYLVLAKMVTMAGVELAEKSGDKTALAIPYFNLAKVFEDLKDTKAAAENYQKAYELVTTFPPASHDRAGVKADFKVHLVTAQYRAGDKTAKIDEAIAELEKSGEEKVSKYNYDVWLSGAHMRAAEVLWTDNKIAAQEHLNKAEEIVKANSELTIRKGQLEKLKERLK